MSDDEGMVVARIRISRHMSPDGGDFVIAEFDDGHDDGDCPAAVELLGMLALTADTVAHGHHLGDDDDE